MKTRIFYLENRQSVENSEIIKVLTQNDCLYKMQETAKVESFVDILAENIVDGFVPILVGWHFYAPSDPNPDKSFLIKKEIPEGVVVMKADQPLLLQVLELLNLEPTLWQRLISWYHRETVSGLILRGFEYDDIQSYTLWELMQKCSNQEFKQICDSVYAGVVKNGLFRVHLPNKKGKFMAQDRAYILSDDKKLDILLTFEDGTAPKYYGNRAVAFNLYKRYGGWISENQWWGSKHSSEEIVTSIEELYAEA